MQSCRIIDHYFFSYHYSVSLYDVHVDVDIPEGITLMKKVTVQLTVAEKEQEGGNESDTNTEQKGQ